MKPKYKKQNIFPYGEVLVPEVREEERGWLTKAIVERIKNRSHTKKQREIELVKLDIELAELKKKLQKIRK